MRRVLHLWQSKYPWEVRVEKINRALTSAGAKVTVLARRAPGEPARAEHEGAAIRRVGFAGINAASLPVPGNPVWRRAIDLAVRQIKPELIIVRDIPLAWTAARLARRHRVPIVLDMAEHYPEAMRAWKKYSENWLLRKLVHDWRVPDRVEARSIALMDGILVVCDEQRDRLIRQFDYPLDKICVVGNTPELGRWADFPKGSSRPRHSVFGYHGNLCEDRELEVVLKGFDLAAEDSPELSLLIAGGGESEASLRALAATLPSRGKIRFTGRYEAKELPSLYAQADFGVVSLRANEFSEHTLANKFFDYAALGKPFIFTGLKPLTRVMSRMKCAVPFEPGSPRAVAEAIGKLRSLDYETLSASGISAVQREFNWGQDSARLLAFLARFKP